MVKNEGRIEAFLTRYRTLTGRQMERQPPFLDFAGKCLVDGIRDRPSVAAVKEQLTALSLGDHESDGTRPDAGND